MKKIILLFVWYFALGNEIFSFSTKAECEALWKYYKQTGRIVSDCLSAKWSPKETTQRSYGDNSPVISNSKGDVNITIDGKKDQR